MQILALSLIRIILLCVFYAVVVKFAAFLLRRSKVSWKHSFFFAIYLMVIVIAERALSFELGGFFSSFWVILVHLSLFMVLGSWYFSTRGTNKNGDSILGWLGGMKLMLLLMFFGVIGAVFLEVIHILYPMMQS
jgi:hypothetical protein